VRLFGVSGKAQSGKTTFANHAISLFGGTKISLADSVKEEVSEFLETCGVYFEQRNLYGSAADREEIFYNREFMNLNTDLKPLLKPYMSYRGLLQVWGTNYRRAQDPQYWVKKAQEKIQKTDGLIFIDDVRFPDECEMVHAENGATIRVSRPGGPRIKESEHISETALDAYADFNLRVFNNGTLKDYHAEVEKLLKLII